MFKKVGLEHAEYSAPCPHTYYTTYFTYDKVLYNFFRVEVLFVFLLKLGKKRKKWGKSACKLLIIKVFQRSDGVNFTYGTWNKVFGEVEGSVSS